tara:strand:- start:248 stop:1039 length:792 start_codon:yes stop_codon:yes gene_type:complete
MSKIIIASSVDASYFQKYHDDWSRSVSKNKSDEMSHALFTIDFQISGNYFNINSTPIQRSSLKFSEQSSSKSNVESRKRKRFICLETGEFVNFSDLNDDDILILTDYDVTMQRPMTEEEIFKLNLLGEKDFAMNRDDYSGSHNLLWFFDKFCLNSEICQDIDESWVQYNTGVQAGRISAWKNIFSIWKSNAEIVLNSIPQHFAFQLFFSYTIQKNNILKEMPVTFHNANWFRDTPAKIKNNQLFVDNDLVLFFHHKFKTRPGF